MDEFTEYLQYVIADAVGQTAGELGYRYMGLTGLPGGTGGTGGTGMTGPTVRSTVCEN